MPQIGFIIQSAFLLSPGLAEKHQGQRLKKKSLKKQGETYTIEKCLNPLPFLCPQSHSRALSDPTTPL